MIFSWTTVILVTTSFEEFGRGRGKAYAPTYYGRGFVQITWEIIDLAKRGNGAYDNHALMLMGAELPRKDDWKKKLVGKFIKKELLQSIKVLISKPPINEVPKTKEERKAKWERENRHHFRDINDHNKRKQLSERKFY